MSPHQTSKAEAEKQKVPGQEPCCTSSQDPYSALPPEVQPTSKPSMGGLRQVTCPECRLEFWTNRVTNRCMKCEVPE